MYSQLHELFKDQVGGTTFACFSIWHFLYMAVIFGAIISTICLLKNKRDKAKTRAVDIAIGIAFGLYMADFFLMPFAYGVIDIDKLPFHACTSMCIMNFWCRHNKFLARFKTQFALIGLISNIIYVIYPAGVMWYGIHPLSYRAWQTILFHGAMTAYGIFVLAFGEVKLEWKKSYKELILLLVMVVWALLGSSAYSGEWPDHYISYNWFFVKMDPFGILPANIAPYLAPIITVSTVFLANMLIYAIYFGIKKLNKKTIEHFSVVLNGELGSTNWQRTCFLCRFVI